MNAQLLSRGVIELSASCFPSLDNSLGNTKRFAIYIPQSFFEHARKALADQAETKSTWEFPALISPSDSISSESTSTLPSTPAQKIAIRYRAGMPACFDCDGPQSDIPVHISASTDDGSSTNLYSPIECQECPSDDISLAGITQTEIKSPHGQSPCPGFPQTLEKATHPDFQTRGFREANSKACPSPNLLRTMVNRMFQPRIHDVQEGRCMLYSPSPTSHENRQEPQGDLQHGLRSIVMNILSKLCRHK